MKKLLAIVVLGLFLFGCNQNRNDEYSCRHQDKSGEALYLNVFKDRFNFASTNYTIEKEMNDKFFAKAKSTGQTATFYKRTKKLKVSFQARDTFLFDCEQLN